MSEFDAASGPPAPRTAFLSREFVLRVVSGLVLGAVVLGALILGGWPFAILWVIAGLAGVGEWYAMSRTEPALALVLVNGTVIAASVFLLLIGGPVWLAGSVLAAGLLALMGLAGGGTRGRRTAAAGLLGGAVVAIVPTVLREDPGIGLVGPAWIFAVVWSTDIVAYFTGRTLGGPKLMPRVSPKKTWSGALGGLAAGTSAGLAVVFVARDHDWSTLDALPLWAITLAGAAASVVSQAGDLFESALKRAYGVKDSGRSIPGHGGVMDRLDGFFAVALLIGFFLIGHAITARIALPV